MARYLTFTVSMKRVGIGRSRSDDLGRHPELQGENTYLHLYGPAWECLPGGWGNNTDLVSPVTGLAPARDAMDTRHAMTTLLARIRGAGRKPAYKA